MLLNTTEQQRRRKIKEICGGQAGGRVGGCVNGGKCDYRAKEYRKGQIFRLRKANIRLTVGKGVCGAGISIHTWF